MMPARCITTRRYVTPFSSAFEGSEISSRAVLFCTTSTHLLEHALAPSLIFVQLGRWVERGKEAEAMAEAAPPPPPKVPAASIPTAPVPR
jgi:hypothetical protein